MNHIKQSKKEIKNALEIFQREIRLPDSQQSFQKYDISAVGKAYFGCPLSSSDNQNQLALCLKANLEYFRKNYKKSLKLLVSCKPKDLHDSFATFYNNIGCVH